MGEQDMARPADHLTVRARDFVRINRTWRIILGEWLDKDRRKVTGPPETWVRLRYRFANGRQLTLNESDIASLDANGVEPVWMHGRAVAHPQDQDL